MSSNSKNTTISILNTPNKIDEDNNIKAKESIL